MGVHPGVGSYIVIRRESKERNGDSLIICHDFCVCLCVCFPGECGGGLNVQPLFPAVEGCDQRVQRHRLRSQGQPH